MRLLTVMYIALCFMMGLMLMLSPWLFPWSENYFFLRYPWVQAVAGNYYIRGAISGVGLADMALGVWESVRYLRRAETPAKSPVIP